MSVMDDAERYAELFQHMNEGRYLLKPIVFENLHPGLVGYFDKNSGDWISIADLSDPEAFLSAGYIEGFGKLEADKYKKDTSEWSTRTSDGESQRSYRANAGASGAAGGVPAEANFDVKYKKGITGSAALITSGLVNYEAFLCPIKDIAEEWLKLNGKRIMERYKSAVKESGIWIIRGVYFTDECATKLDSGSNSEIDVGADIGATGFGKLGGGTGSIDSLKSKRYTTRPAVPGSKGQVISFHGVKFKPKSIFKLLSSKPLTFDMSCSAGPSDKSQRPIYDESGNLKGFEAVERVLKAPPGSTNYYDSQFEIQKAEQQETAEDPVDEDDEDYEGMTKEDIQIEKEEKEKQKQERYQALLESWEGFVKETETRNQYMAAEKAKGSEAPPPIETITIRR